MNKKHLKNGKISIWKLDSEHGDKRILEQVENNPDLYRNVTGEFNTTKLFALTKENNRGFTFTFKVFGNNVQTVFLSRAQYEIRSEETEL